MQTTAVADDRAVFAAVGLARSSGRVGALEDDVIHIEPGEPIGPVAPNGAGWTTVCNLLSGALRPDARRIYRRGTEVIDRRTHEPWRDI